MEIDEVAIGQWPNIAIDPRTGRHAATGEQVDVPTMAMRKTIGLAMTVRCDFCGNSAETCKWLVASPIRPVHICDMCVKTTAEAIEMEEGA